MSSRIDQINGKGLSLVIGRPGTGKTYLLNTQIIDSVIDESVKERGYCNVIFYDLYGTFYDKYRELYEDERVHDVLYASDPEMFHNNDYSDYATPINPNEYWGLMKTNKNTIFIIDEASYFFGVISAHSRGSGKAMIERLSSTATGYRHTGVKQIYAFHTLQKTPTELVTAAAFVAVMPTGDQLPSVRGKFDQSSILTYGFTQLRKQPHDKDAGPYPRVEILGSEKAYLIIDQKGGGSEETELNYEEWIDKKTKRR